MRGGEVEGVLFYVEKNIAADNQINTKP
jgi:hypothetical protein